MIKILAFHCYNSKKAILQREFPDKCECGFWLFFKCPVYFGFLLHVNHWRTGKLLFPSETNSCLCIYPEKMLCGQDQCLSPEQYVLADHKHIVFPFLLLYLVICMNIHFDLPWKVVREVALHFLVPFHPQFYKGKQRPM